MLHRLDVIARLVLDVPADLDVVGLNHHKSSYGKRADELFLERRREPNPVPGGRQVVRLVETEDFANVDEELILSERSRGWRRRVARALIERFLLRGPSTAEDLASDVMVVDISRETFERARSELAADGVIERFQKDGQHWWRMVVPDRLPDDLR